VQPRRQLPHYFGQNLLAASLNRLSYEKNPGFISFIKRKNARPLSFEFQTAHFEIDLAAHHFRPSSKFSLLSWGLGVSAIEWS